MTRTVDALVLAGRRGGAQDPLAAAAGVSHKAIAPVAGRPMIAHVLTALEAAGYRRILVSIDDPAVLAAEPTTLALQARGVVTLIPAAPSLFDSVRTAAGLAQFPLTITTADNVLLTPDILAAMDAAAAERAADAAAAFARREAVLAAHPDGQRRFYGFRDGAYSNCNLYWVRGRGAFAAARIFREGGQFAKHPARILAAFGLINLLLFRSGWLSLAGMMRRISGRFRLNLEAVVLDDGAAAIDVDNLRTHAIAEQLLLARARRAAA